MFPSNSPEFMLFSVTIASPGVICTPPMAGERSIVLYSILYSLYCDERVYVCLFLCLSATMYRDPHVQISVPAACDHGSVPLWAFG